ncbi:MAG: glycosyl transferase [Sphingomonadales bacterium]|nr:glycosyl transferase [Sphingomonadales bacterium]
MKIFYAVQATGNGHISRAMTLLPHLQQWGTVDVFLSGNNSHLTPQLPVRYRSRGISLYYNNAGGLDYPKIAFQRNPLELFKEIKELPVKKYDLVINDFDFLTSAACRLQGVSSVHFGHQASFHYPETPRPVHRQWHGELLLKDYVQATHHIGLHFEKYHSSIFGAIIKEEIVQATPVNGSHVTVYLPACSDWALKRLLTPINGPLFEIFSRETKVPYREGHLQFRPIEQAAFNQSLIGCSGIICGAGFETPAEALQLGKKILAIPIKGQYEQYCNAAALNRLGIKTLPPSQPIETHHITDWLEKAPLVQVDYSRSIQESVEHLMAIGINSTTSAAPPVTWQEACAP